MGYDGQAHVDAVGRCLDEYRVVGEVLVLFLLRQRQQLSPSGVAEDLQRAFGSDPLGVIKLVLGVFLKLFEAFVEHIDRLTLFAVFAGVLEYVHPIREIRIHERAGVNDQVVERVDQLSEIR